MKFSFSQGDWKIPNFPSELPANYNLHEYCIVVQAQFLTRVLYKAWTKNTYMKALIF